MLQISKSKSIMPMVMMAMTVAASGKMIKPRMNRAVYSGAAAIYRRYICVILMMMA